VTSALMPSKKPARVPANAGCIVSAAVAAVSAAAPIAGTAAWKSELRCSRNIRRRIKSAEAAASAALRDIATERTGPCREKADPSRNTTLRPQTTLNEEMRRLSFEDSVVSKPNLTKQQQCVACLRPWSLLTK
jgi:hypothetical protein